MPRLDPANLRVILHDLPVEMARDAGGEPRLVGKPQDVLGLLGRLRDHEATSMRRLVDLTAIDRGGQAGRFEIVYVLQSPTTKAGLRVHVGLDGVDPEIDSVVGLWACADWLEREVFDLFGIVFRGHPDLRRILLAPDFEGAPLRRDFPRQPGTRSPEGGGR
ncbi:MAG TPA: NADH-quinone oxidoreductase subunit C [Deltaproteobacteria bacterium]|nr:NADH-quinone oxidoreductase subunit C [Deltaproteobacteria bacterium]